MYHERPRRDYKVTERELDAAAEIHGSYDEAYRHLGVTPDEVEFESAPFEAVAAEPELPPIVVSLADRALALTDIMAYFNKANQLQGYVKHKTGQGIRNGRPVTDSAALERNVRGSLRRMRPKFDEGLATLVAADALRAHGYDEAAIDLAQRAMQAQLNRAYGPGNAYAQDRAALVKKATRAA